MKANTLPTSAMCVHQTNGAQYHSLASCSDLHSHVYSPPLTPSPSPHFLSHPFTTSHTELFLVSHIVTLHHCLLFLSCIEVCVTSLHTCYIIHWFVMCPPHTKLTCKIVSVFVMCSYCVCVCVWLYVAGCVWLWLCRSYVETRWPSIGWLTAGVWTSLNPLCLTEWCGLVGCMVCMCIQWCLQTVYVYASDMTHNSTSTFFNSLSKFLFPPLPNQSLCLQNCHRAISTCSLF